MSTTMPRPTKAREATDELTEAVNNASLALLRLSMALAASTPTPRTHGGPEGDSRAR